MERGDEIDSSPVIAAPELHAEIFDSPAGRGNTAGVNILTPARGRREGTRRNGSASKNNESAKGTNNLWDSDSEDGEGAIGGMSPPKTIQFHIPQGRLVRTPGMQAVH